MSMRERKSQIVMRWRIDRRKREDDVMGTVLGVILFWIRQIIDEGKR